MKPKEKALRLFDKWYKSLRTYSGKPARGTIAAALVVLERLKESYDLKLDHHRAAGRSQIKGASGAAVSKILNRFGESRPFLSEGGRTNRGAPGEVGHMLNALKSAGLGSLGETERNQVIEALQEYLVQRVQEYHSRQKLKAVYEPHRSTRQNIADLLALARERGQEGAVAQYLVGAKLQVRFPDINIENKSYSTADELLDRPGDFCVRDTVFHITVSPMLGLYEKCKRNLADGLRVYLLVSERSVMGTKQNVDNVFAAPEKIAVESIESFVSQNIEELSDFSTSKLLQSFRTLLETYNRRVDAIENDKSLLVEIPRNLR